MLLPGPCDPPNPPRVQPERPALPRAFPSPTGGEQTVLFWSGADIDLEGQGWNRLSFN